MNKKRITIIFIIILIIFIISLFSYLILNSKDDMHSVLLKDNYQIKETHKKGESENGYTYKGDSVYYKKDEINIFVYEYDSFEIAREEVLVNYEDEKANGLVINFIDKDNYTEKELCHGNDICNIAIASGNKYISVLYNKSETTEVKQDINEILNIN